MSETMELFRKRSHYMKHLPVLAMLIVVGGATAWHDYRDEQFRMVFSLEPVAFGELGHYLMVAMGLIMFSFSSLWMATYIYELVGKRPNVVISQDGLTYRQFGFRQKFYAHEDITSVESYEIINKVKYLYNQRIPMLRIGVRVADGSVKIKELGLWGLDGTSDEVIQELSRFASPDSEQIG